MNPQPHTQFTRTGKAQIESLSNEFPALWLAVELGLKEFITG